MEGLKLRGDPLPSTFKAEWMQAVSGLGETHGVCRRTRTWRTFPSKQWSKLQLLLKQWMVFAETGQNWPPVNGHLGWKGDHSEHVYYPGFWDVRPWPFGWLENLQANPESKTDEVDESWQSQDLPQSTILVGGRKPKYGYVIVALVMSQNLSQIIHLPRVR